MSEPVWIAFLTAWVAGALTLWRCARQVVAARRLTPLAPWCRRCGQTLRGCETGLARDDAVCPKCGLDLVAQPPVVAPRRPPAVLVVVAFIVAVGVPAYMITELLYAYVIPKAYERQEEYALTQPQSGAWDGCDATVTTRGRAWWFDASPRFDVPDNMLIRFSGPGSSGGGTYDVLYIHNNRFGSWNVFAVAARAVNAQTFAQRLVAVGADPNTPRVQTEVDSLTQFFVNLRSGQQDELTAAAWPFHVTAEMPDDTELPPTLEEWIGLWGLVLVALGLVVAWALSLYELPPKDWDLGGGAGVDPSDPDALVVSSVSAERGVAIFFTLIYVAAIVLVGVLFRPRSIAEFAGAVGATLPLGVVLLVGVCAVRAKSRGYEYRVDRVGVHIRHRRKPPVEVAYAEITDVRQFESVVVCRYCPPAGGRREMKMQLYCGTAAFAVRRAIEVGRAAQRR